VTHATGSQGIQTSDPRVRGVKKTWQVCSTDLMKVRVQMVKNSGESNLHTHTGEDAFWYIISGAVKRCAVDKTLF
jgi:hypothetical protein